MGRFTSSTSVDDEWLRIEGTLLQQSGRWILEAASVVPVGAPKDPYLY